MPARLFLAALPIAFFAAACSNTFDDSGDTAAGAPASETADSGASADLQTTTTTVSGPTTTFVPNLAGPFDLDGGAERAADGDDLIVDPGARADLPQPIASYIAWTTDWSRRTIDFDELGAGLPGDDPRDRIPPIDTPVFESVALASQWLGPREPGALVQLVGEARFYPLSILHQHEIVNDAFGDVPVAVTYCPLCNTALAFDRRVDGQVLRFGVSGLLRNSDLVMWDDATTSLWQQITGDAIVGEFAGTRLDTVSTAIVSFDQFRTEFPDGKSLAGESGRGRGAYGRNPYTFYSSQPRPFLFGGELDDRYPALSRVVGLAETDPPRAYPFDKVRDAQVVNDVVGETPVAILWGGDTADALDSEAVAVGQEIGSAIAFDPVVDGTALTFAPGAEPDTFVDEQTGSTWSVLGLAIDGELEGTRLDTLPHRNEFWFAWIAFFGGDDIFGGS